MTTAVPSIRGAVLRQSIDWLGSLVVAKRTSPLALGVRLEAEDFALFTQKIDADGWYPMASAARIDDALVLAHGGPPECVMLELGARRAHRLLQSFPCALDQLAPERHGIDPADLFRQTPPFNFGRWQSRIHSPSHLALHLDDAAPLPETTRFNLQGFLQVVISELKGARVQLTSERVDADRAVFHARARPLELRGGDRRPALGPGPAQKV